MKWLRIEKAQNCKCKAQNFIEELSILFFVKKLVFKILFKKIKERKQNLNLMEKLVVSPTNIKIIWNFLISNSKYSLLQINESIIWFCDRLPNDYPSDWQYFDFVDYTSCTFPHLIIIFNFREERLR